MGSEPSGFLSSVSDMVIGCIDAHNRLVLDVSCSCDVVLVLVVDCFASKIEN